MSTSVTRDDKTGSSKGGQSTNGRAPQCITFSPDTGWAWVVALASMVNIFLHVGLYRSLGIFVVELMDIYDAPTAKVSLIFTCAAIGFGATSIMYIFGIGDIVHERALVVTSSLLAFCGYLVTFFSTRIEHICAQGFFTGAAMQIGMTCGMSMVGWYFDKRRTIASGVVMSGVSLGVLVFPPVLQWLLNEYTYRGTALICAGLTLNSLVCCSLMRPVPRTGIQELILSEQSGSEIISAVQGNGGEDKTVESDLSQNDMSRVAEVPPRRHGCQSIDTNVYINAAYVAEMEDRVSESRREVTDVSSTVISRRDRRSVSFFKAVKIFSLKDTGTRSVNVSFWKRVLPSVSLLKNPVLPFLQLFMISSTVGSECVVQFYPISTREVGMSEYQSAFLLSIAGVGDLLSRTGLGLLGDYNIMARYKLVMIPQFVLGTACFLSRFATEFWSQGIFAVVIGLTYGVGYAYRAVLLIDFLGLQELNRSLGISNFVSSFGFISGSPIVGYLRDLTGNFEVPLQIIGTMLFAAGASILVAGLCKWRQGRNRERYDLN